jgi:hypothetical protein
MGTGGGATGGVGDTVSCPGETKGTWVAMSTTMAPSGISTPYWTGAGLYAEYRGVDAALFDPCANAWQASPKPPVFFPQFEISVPAADQLQFFAPTRSAFAAFDYHQNQQLTLSLSGAIDADFGVFVSTGAKAIAWGGGVPRSGSAGWDGTQAGAIYDPAKDAWTAMTTTGAPAARVAPGVWTGTDLVVWGGHSATTYMQGVYQIDCADALYDDQTYSCVQYGDGAFYDPARDVWTPMASAGAPSPRFDHLLAWTGDRVLVWGGGDKGTGDVTLGTPAQQWLSDGGIYDPVAKAWTAVAASPLPDTGYQLSTYWVLWTGDYMATGNKLLEGWILDPHANVWSTLSPPGTVTSCGPLLTAQAGALVAVCTVDGVSAAVLRLPGESTWRSYPLPNGLAPSPNIVWTGKRLFVWGGMFAPAYTCPAPTPQMPGCDPPPPTYSDAGYMLVP